MSDSKLSSMPFNEQMRWSHSEARKQMSLGQKLVGLFDPGLEDSLAQLIWSNRTMREEVYSLPFSESVSREAVLLKKWSGDSNDKD